MKKYSTYLKSDILPFQNLNILPQHGRIITEQHFPKVPTGHIGHSDTLAYCVSGFFIMHINGQNFLLRPNQMVYSPSGTWRGKWGLQNHGELYEVPVRGDASGQNIFEYLHLREGDYVVDVPEEYRARTMQNFNSIVSSSLYIENYLFLTSAIVDLIGIYVASHAKRQQESEFFLPVLRYMQEHLADNVRLPHLAALMYMQPPYFIRSFKKTFQQSPIAYYNVLRAAKAIDLLSTTDLPLYAIAERIGISDQYYFSNFFKTQCGISPNQYRKAAKSMLAQIDM